MQTGLKYIFYDSSWELPYIVNSFLVPFYYMAFDWQPYI